MAPGCLNLNRGVTVAFFKDLQPPFWDCYMLGGPKLYSGDMSQKAAWQLVNNWVI